MPKPERGSFTYTFTSICQSPMKWERKAKISLFLSGNKDVTLFSYLRGNDLSTEIKEFRTECCLLVFFFHLV